MAESTYFVPSLNLYLSKDELASCSEEEQIEAMEHWFSEHFEHPDNRTPYESAEGGYIWIWGGPFNAREELYSEFSFLPSEQPIAKLTAELENESTEWGPAESPEDYEGYLLEDVAEITEYFSNFETAMNSNVALMSEGVDDKFKHHFCRLIYANMITILETYLSTAFINTIVSNKDFVRKFVKSTPEFAKELVPLSDVFSVMDNIDHKVSLYLSEVMWHNLSKVARMYSDTLNIPFPKDLGIIYRAILIRHDIVHRNGLTKDGKEHSITIIHLGELSSAIRQLVCHIDLLLCPMRSNPSLNSGPTATVGFPLHPF